MNGLGAPSVIPPFALGLGNLGTPLTTGAYGNAIPSLGAFALATTQGIGQTNPTSLRGISNVLLVSNLNEEVSTFDIDHFNLSIVFTSYQFYFQIESHFLLSIIKMFSHFCPFYKFTYLFYVFVLFLFLLFFFQIHKTKCAQTLYDIFARF